MPRAKLCRTPCLRQTPPPPTTHQLFEGNSGGCLAAGAGSLSMATVTIARCTFRRCAKGGASSPNTRGGALSVVLAASGSPAPKLDVSQSHFEGSTVFGNADIYGAAVAVTSTSGSSAVVTITRSSFADNRALGVTPAINTGGASPAALITRGCGHVGRVPPAMHSKMRLRVLLVTDSTPMLTRPVAAAAAAALFADGPASVTLSQSTLTGAPCVCRALGSLCARAACRPFPPAGSCACLC